MSLDAYQECPEVSERTKELFLVYENRTLKVCAFIDANIKSFKDNSKSQSGFMFTLKVVFLVRRVSN